MTKVNVTLSRESILYGYFRPCKFKGLTNLALLVAKYFICKCFLNEKSLDFELYKLQLREKALTEPKTTLSLSFQCDYSNRATWNKVNQSQS